MKALTLHQPWASLCVPLAPGEEPVKTIVTQKRSTEYRGRLLIHAGKTTEWEQVKVGPWRLHAEYSDVPEIRRVGSVYNGELVRDRYEKGLAAPAPLGAIVGSCELVDVVPIVDMGEEEAVRRAEVGWASGEPNLMLCAPHPDGEAGVDFDGSDFYENDVSDQLPYGDFTPGRYAWLLEDAKRTDERCPACWGEGGGNGWPQDDSWCRICEGAGSCDPIPAKGKQGLWEWTP